MSLLSLSPLLSSLFLSYANRAATLESASTTPSPISEEWKTLQATVTALREENEKLKLETREMANKLKAAEASQEAFRSQVSNLNGVNATQREDIESLRAECSKIQDEHDRLMVDSNAQMVRVLDLEVRLESFLVVDWTRLLIHIVWVGTTRRIEGDNCRTTDQDIETWAPDAWQWAANSPHRAGFAIRGFAHPAHHKFPNSFPKSFTPPALAAGLPFPKSDTVS